MDDKELIEQQNEEILNLSLKVNANASVIDFLQKAIAERIREALNRGRVRAAFDPVYALVRRDVMEKRDGINTKWNYERVKRIGTHESLADVDDVMQRVVKIATEFGFTATKEQIDEMVIYDSNRLQKKAEAARAAAGEPKNYFLNEQHTTHVTKAQVRKEREERKAKKELYDRLSRFLSAKEKKMLSKALLGLEMSEEKKSNG